MTQDRSDSSMQDAPSSRSVWRSGLVWVAVVVTVAGFAIWGYAMATAERPAAPGEGGDTSALVSGFAGAVKEQVAPPEPRLVDRVAPTLARLGPSFLAGFFLAWAIRKGVKLALLVGGAIVVGVLVLRQLDVFEVDWDAVQSSVSDGVEWATTEAKERKDALIALLPSGGAAAAGMIFGARWK